MLTAKDIPIVEGVELEWTWEVSGRYTLPQDGYIGSSRKGIKVNAGDLFVEYWRVDERYETGARDGFVKSVEHRYVHVPTGTACDAVTTNYRIARSEWIDKRDGQRCVNEWETFDHVFKTFDESKRQYKTRMPTQHKVVCECGCGRAVDDCDNDFGRFEV